MKTMQAFAKDLPRSFWNLTQDADSWDAEVENKIRLLSGELCQFVRPDILRVSVHAIEVMTAYGRITYELTRELISYLEPEKLTRRP
jgi:hypothetical protein